jgi:hypothetical protein
MNEKDIQKVNKVWFPRWNSSLGKNKEKNELLSCGVDEAILNFLIFLY